jgi:hypothetical protein
MFIENF